jgi:hypothetical protein
MQRTSLVPLLIFIVGCAAPSALPPSIPTPTPLRPAPTTMTTAPTQTVVPTQTPRAATATARPAPNTALPTHTALPTPTALAVLPTPPPNSPTVVISNDPVLIGAGDIAVCGAKGDEATAALLEAREGIIFTLGDNVYPNGTPQEFQECYDPSWGKLKARTRPIPGNHDYNTENALGYYTYFGASAGDPSKGYYAYDVGAWHIVALNSEVDTRANSPQVQWLLDDLAQSPARCTLALFHRPLFSSGPHGRDGSGEKTRALWEGLYENNADVILNGHDHDYERFAPQNPQGARDDARGIRQFVVGTGGAAPYQFGAIRPNSEKRFTGPFGVLKLTLHAASYDWEFISIAPLLFSDHGSGRCH